MNINVATWHLKLEKMDTKMIVAGQEFHNRGTSMEKTVSLTATSEGGGRTLVWKVLDCELGTTDILGKDFLYGLMHISS